LHTLFYFSKISTPKIKGIKYDYVVKDIKTIDWKLQYILKTQYKGKVLYSSSRKSIADYMITKLWDFMKMQYKDKWHNIGDKYSFVLNLKKNGDLLPSRREIAATLEINPNTAQKAFKLMEEEGYVITSGNTGSMIYVDELVLAKVETELTHDMVQDFIQSAKDINLSFKKVFDLISDMWEDT